MSKDAIPPPLHRYKPDGPFSNCAFMDRRRRCNRHAGSPVHRYYPCRQPGCMKNDMQSIESRDRHEANVHGSGW